MEYDGWFVADGNVSWQESCTVVRVRDVGRINHLHTFSHASRLVGPACHETSLQPCLWPSHDCDCRATFV